MARREKFGNQWCLEDLGSGESFKELGIVVRYRGDATGRDNFRYLKGFLRKLQKFVIFAHFKNI